jgi:hypothetical protein
MWYLLVISLSKTLFTRGCRGCCSDIVVGLSGDVSMETYEDREESRHINDACLLM